MWRARSNFLTCRRNYHVLLTVHLRLQTPAVRDLAIMNAAASDAEAQQWLGWPEQQVLPAGHRDRLLTLEPGHRPGPSRYGDSWLLVAVDRVTGLVAGAAALNVRTLEAGGWLAPGFRGHGLGAELFTAIAEFGHEHVGIATIRAGTETANAACVAALLAAGFGPARGPEVHRLPSGRAVQARWFQHDTRLPARCRR